MAWTNLTNAALSTGKYLTQAIARALRDNVSAVANGDAGAPRIVAAAIPVQYKDVVIATNAAVSLGLAAGDKLIGVWNNVQTDVSTENQGATYRLRVTTVRVDDVAGTARRYYSRVSVSSGGGGSADGGANTVGGADMTIRIAYIPAVAPSV